MPSLSAFSKRFCRRVIQDVPADLEAMACEDPLGVLRHHVPRLIDGIGRYDDARGPAYTTRPFFSIPGSPPVSRLRSADGHIPFHFAKNMVEGRTAQAFDAYARGKGQGLEPDAPGEGLAKALDVGIDGAAKDAYMRGHGGQGGGPADGWTNLRDPADWNVVETFERDRRPHPEGNPPGISIFYARAPALFDEIARDAECPAGLRKAIAKEQKRVAAGRPLSNRKARDGVRWIDARAFDVYAWIKTQDHWPDTVDKTTRPARVSEGRAVQTHLAGEGEYHADLGADACARIQAGMIDLVQRQRNPASTDEPGWFIPMTICDHMPDGLNDPLNDHFHWLMGTRQARYLEDGSLEFEANKVGAITRDGWIDVMREEVARLTNIELATIDADVRYHPGTLAEMGIDATAQRKMHGRRTVLERAGFSTERGLSNDVEGWRRVFAAAATNHAAELGAIDRALPAPDPNHERARAAKVEAVELRHEAAQIQILIDMSRSRAARTARFAPEYATVTTSPRAVAGWTERGREAERHLQALDLELKLEQEAVADRVARAARMEIEAIELLARSALSADNAKRLEPVDMHEHMTVPTVTPTHRAIDLIAKAPLLVSGGEHGLAIDPRDDPDDLVRGVDLGGGREQRRLAGIRAAQQRELAQVQAFARRHGAASLFDETCDTHSAWFGQAVRKWRDTPVMERHLAKLETRIMHERQVDARERYGRRTARAASEIIELDELPSLADVPFLADIWDIGDDRLEPTGLREEQVVRGPAEDTPAPALPAQDKPSAPSPPSRPEIVWTQLERDHRDHIEWRAERHRVDVAQEIDRALIERVGDGDAITPYAARLIEKVGKGFDPARVGSRIGPVGPTLDQRDAAEMAVLSRHPKFRAYLETARRSDPKTARLVAAAPPATTGPDFLGRVAVTHGRIGFGAAAPTAPGNQSPLRTPLEWARDTVAVIAERGMPLSRRDGLVGLHDGDVLRFSNYNYLGLLHLEIQHALDVQRRIQAEVEREILSRVRTGALKVEASIKQDARSLDVRTHVRLIGGTPEDRAFVDLRQFDAGFYFRSREAAAGLPAPALRHDSAVVRAWLTASDEGAAAPVVDLLAQQVRALAGGVGTAGMTDGDARALGALLKPPPAAITPSRKLRGPRSRLPLHPGRLDPSR
ncbi:hypothetical protein [Sphingomonas sp. 10B4]|uniref:hypothetical protein n=1 Tax=Sphingomonas sp. 10B4 TaxID=3048575 RepID=UPI002AB46E6D|nr:hypothetical protein [Sphingomonas sp. 10B4]MDY7524601.1 hypothetical protein [Sphingomonas sp. 10B4]MEB0282442.1 hypothetical protein [Sphingomonas sp. 10B4]